ncbi:MAG: D-aminoacyl-tRNA deacylase [Christensenellales bacterium]|jgi:D-tyrosyl-tRNA(Tyr) deacylase
MRAVVQRVLQASVSVEGELISQIGKGFMVLVAVMDGDTPADIGYIAKKLCALRVFEDEDGKMNRSITDVGGRMLIISQFTLAGDARKGNRPGFTASAQPDIAQEYYDLLCDSVSKTVPVEKGIFAADMQVALINDGPVTILLDSGKLF